MRFSSRYSDPTLASSVCPMGSCHLPNAILKVLSTITKQGLEMATRNTVSGPPHRIK